mmetsp:Transcript_35206/g.99667  ORF Transcript_35206/g.99667 Transcript_35206/m.99667 type:complete len:361 (+) Transcript_35206:322-1404(+)
MVSSTMENRASYTGLDPFCSVAVAFAGMLLLLSGEAVPRSTDVRAGGLGVGCGGGAGTCFTDLPGTSLLWISTGKEARSSEWLPSREIRTKRVQRVRDSGTVLRRLSLAYSCSRLVSLPNCSGSTVIEFRSIHRRFKLESLQIAFGSCEMLLLYSHRSTKDCIFSMESGSSLIWLRIRLKVVHFVIAARKEGGSTLILLACRDTASTELAQPRAAGRVSIMLQCKERRSTLGGRSGAAVSLFPFKDSHLSFVSCVMSGVTRCNWFSLKAMYSNGGGGLWLHSESGISFSRLLWQSSLRRCRIPPISTGNSVRSVSLMSSHTTLLADIWVLRTMKRSRVARSCMSVSRPMGHRWPSPVSWM